MNTERQLSFTGDLGKYELEKTADGSYTLWSEAFNEACHSKNGAYQETLFNYIEGCNLKEIAKKQDTINILDVGFGMGLGLKVTIEFLRNQGINNQINYFSMELDKKLVEWSIKHIMNTKSITIEKQLWAQKKGHQYFHGANTNLSILILIGNARKTVPALKDLIPPIDIIYQDAFSSGKNPELWSVEWFQLLKELSNPKVILSTFSASTNIRKSLLEAGWTVIERPGFLNKKSSTQATLTGKTDQKLTEKLINSPIPSLRDCEIIPR